MNYIYTASKLATSTAERKLARIIPASFIANPFTIWTTDDTDGALCTPSKTEYTTVHRARNNRKTRKALAREKITPIAA